MECIRILPTHDRIGVSGFKWPLGDDDYERGAFVSSRDTLGKDRSRAHPDGQEDACMHAWMDRSTERTTRVATSGLHHQRLRNEPGRIKSETERTQRAEARSSDRLPAARCPLPTPTNATPAKANTLAASHPWLCAIRTTHSSASRNKRPITAILW